MKHIFVLSGLMFLAACSSVGDAYTVGSRVDTVGESNARITKMRSSVDNRLEVIEYAQSVGVISETTSGATSSNLSRIGVSGSPLNRDPNVRDQQDEKIGTLYAQALSVFKNMYKIHTDGLEGLNTTEIKNAYLIAGGTGNLDELSNDEMKEFIDANCASVLNKFFNPGDENTWIFEPKTESLSDVEMQIVSSDDVLAFTLGDNGQIMEIRLTDGGYVRTGNKSNTFWRKDSTTGDETIVAIKASGNLKYSDYGRFSKAVKSAETGKTTTEYKFFAGGYDLKHIDRSTVALAAGEDSLDFKGTAMGLLQNNNNDIKSINGDATLNFMNGTETIDLKFSNSNWYDVKIEDTGSSQTISFAPGNEIDTRFLVSQPNTTLEYDGMRIDYYGDRGNPSEFVGTATYQDANGVLMESAFGGTLIKPETN